MVERPAVNRQVRGSSPRGGAKLDERLNWLSCQTVLSSQIGLFYPLTLSSEVSFLKVAVFRGLQAFKQLTCVRSQF